MEIEKKKMVQKTLAKTISKHKYVLIFIGIMVFMTSVMTYLYNPLRIGHDLEAHINRLYCLMESIADGSFPIYMDYYPIKGYGYLMKIFYSDLLFIPFALIGLATNVLFAYQVMIFTLTMLSGIFMYKAFHIITKNNVGATAAGIMYAFAIYRIINVYMRAAVGEVYAMTFIPLVIWGMYELLFGNYRKWYIFAIAYTLIIYSHVITTVLCFFFILFFFIVYYKRFLKEPKRFYYLLVAVVTCLLLSVYYMLPMIEQMLSNKFQYHVENEFRRFLWHFEFYEIIEGMFTGITHQTLKFFPKIGVLLTMVVTLRVFVTLKGRIGRFFDICLILGLISVLCTTGYIPWKRFPFNILTFVQFAWRFNIFVCIFFSMAGAYYISILAKNKKQKISSILLLILLHLIILNGDSLHYKKFVFENLSYDISVTTEDMGIGVGREYLPSTLELYHIKSREDVVTQNEDTKISNFYKDQGHITLEATVTKSDNIELPLTYYIGYKATLDNQPIEIQQSKIGLIELPINKSGSVEVQYIGTPLQKVCWYITLISILVLIAYIIYANRKQNDVNP